MVLGGDGFNLGNAYGKIILDSSGVDSGIQQAKQSLSSGLQSMGAGLQSFGGQMMGIGGALGVIAAPAALFLKNATDQFNNYNEAMTNIQAVTGATADEMEGLSSQIMDIGEHSRAGPQAVAEAFYDIAGGVVDASARMPTLIAAVKAAEAGNADLAGTTKALISVMNGYGFAADKAGYVSDVLTQTVAKGVGTMDDFASALPNVAGMANSLGISFEDLGGMMAYLTTKGISASEASTQLSAMMTSLLNPSKDMSDALHALGYENGTAAIKALGLVGVFKKLKDSGYDVAQLGGRVEALRGTIALTGDGAQEFLDNFSNGLDGLTEATQKIQDASPAAQADFFNSAMQTLSITVGESLAPAMNALLGEVLPVIDSFITWARQNPELVAQIAQIVLIVAGLSAGLIALGAVISAAGALLSGLGAIIAFIMSPIGLLITFIVALVIAFQTNFMGIRDLLQPIVDSIVTKIREIVGAVGDVLSKIGDWIAKNPEFVVALGIIAGAIGGLVLVVNGLGLALGVVTAAFGLLLSPIVILTVALVALVAAIQAGYPGGISQMLRDAATSAQMLAAIFMGVLAVAADWARQRLSELLNVVLTIIDKIQTFKTNLETSMSGISGIIGGVTSGQWTVGQVIQAIGNEIGSNAPNGGSVGNAVQSFAANMPQMGGSKDSGGFGAADMAYLIGKGAQPEMFMPHTSGTFIPNADKLFGGGGDTYNVTIVLPDSALADPAAARNAGQMAYDTFEQRILERKRSRG